MFPGLPKFKNPIYLDYAASTPVDPAVLKVMRPYFSMAFGNPSSLYKQGVEAREAIESSRKKIAGVVGARISEIIFTAGGTESCNLAIFGAARKYKPAKKFRPHIVSCAIEHHAVLGPIKTLTEEGFEATILPVDKNGLVNSKELLKAIRPETILVSIMYANNEIGAIEPVAEIAGLIRQNNRERRQKHLPEIIFHTDACQAAGSLDLNINRLGVDLMSVNGSKIYGPKQIGFLFVRDGINLKPLIYGGGQERGLRSGTENVPGIVGLAKALELSQKIRESENRRIGKLQHYFISRLVKLPGVELNGPKPGILRLANNINVTIKGVEGEALLLYLDSFNIAVSTGSACTTGKADPSHVLLALGRSPLQSKSSIRMTLGKQTTKREIDYTLKVLKPLILELRKTNNFLL